MWNALAGGEGTPVPPGCRQRWVSGQLPCWSSDRDRWWQGWPCPTLGVLAGPGCLGQPFPGHRWCCLSGQWGRADPAQGSVPGSVGWQEAPTVPCQCSPHVQDSPEVFPSAQGISLALTGLAFTQPCGQHLAVPPQWCQGHPSQHGDTVGAILGSGDWGLPSPPACGCPSGAALGGQSRSPPSPSP